MRCDLSRPRPRRIPFAAVVQEVEIRPRARADIDFSQTCRIAAGDKRNHAVRRNKTSINFRSELPTLGLVDRSCLNSEDPLSRLVTITWWWPYRRSPPIRMKRAGTLDMDSELKICTSGRTEPIQKTLKRGANIRGIEAAIAAAL